MVLGSTLAEGALTDIPGMIYDEVKRRMHKPVNNYSLPSMSYDMYRVMTLVLIQLSKDFMLTDV